ncbi:MAG: flagellar basal body P-ring protein FlgI, partial [Planctomycetota bacterium]
MNTNFVPISLVAIGMMTVTIFASGCGNVIRRGQSPDDSLMKFSERNDSTRFIGEICGVRGLRPMQIEGIGLVVGLEGTGSEPAPSSQKDYLLKELKTNRTTPNPKSAIASKNTSMVMIRGMIPPAAKKGDKIDLEIITPPRSDTRSLKYGELLKTDLRPMAFLSRSVKLGNVLGKAKGIVLVDSLFESSQDDQHLMKGRILGGGTLDDDRPITLVIHSEDTSVKLTRMMAHSINQRYSSYSAEGRDDAANPVTDRIIELNIPDEYKHNLGRFIQSLQAMAYGEKVSERAERLKDLDRRISDPETARRAAIELEAIGSDGVLALQQALKHPDFEVRFYAAESLAYMGETDGIDILQIAAKNEPAFRWHALTALASINHPVADSSIKELLNLPSAETRYGAFRSLQASSPNDRSIKGKLLVDEYYLHEIESDADCIVHFSRTKKPEIVVFGNQRVSENFLYVEAGLTVKAIDKDRIQVIQFNPVEGKKRVTCSTNIADLIATLARF